MKLRRVMTESSMWLFDMERKTYVRMPRNEAPNARGTIPYSEKWEPFIAIVEPGEVHEELTNNFADRLFVIRPVPHGTGRHRHTGIIETDVVDEIDHGSVA